MGAFRDNKHGCVAFSNKQHLVPNEAPKKKLSAGPVFLGQRSENASLVRTASNSPVTGNIWKTAGWKMHHRLDHQRILWGEGVNVCSSLSSWLSKFLSTAILLSLLLDLPFSYILANLILRATRFFSEPPRGCWMHLGPQHGQQNLRIPADSYPLLVFVHWCVNPKKCAELSPPSQPLHL